MSILKRFVLPGDDGTRIFQMTMVVIFIAIRVSEHEGEWDSNDVLNIAAQATAALIVYGWIGRIGTVTWTTVTQKPVMERLRG